MLWSVIRWVYRRYEGLEAAAALADLYRSLRLFVNFFQPSFKLAEKSRVGAKVTKRYHAPATPHQRLISDPRTTAATRERVAAVYATLDPVQLLNAIRSGQQRLVEIADRPVFGSGEGLAPTTPTLEEFLSGLRTAWREGEVRPTSKPKEKAKRGRRRPDPLVAVTTQLHDWFEAEPWRTARWLTRSRAFRFKVDVTTGIDLATLSHADKDALILSLIARLDVALGRIAELEKRLAAYERPPKTPDNSSMPPSRGQKPNHPPGDKPPCRNRPGVGRLLEPNPDRVVDATLDACPHCTAAFALDRQTPQQVYDRIELPPIKPDVTRVRLFGGCCGERATAEAPAGLEPGSPFGLSIAALVVYLHYAQAIGLERLAALMGEVFGLSISEGAISNILARARTPLAAAADAIRDAVVASPVVCSDETSARVSGKTWWEWVFVTHLAVLHVIRPSRGKAVVHAVFGGARPLVWVSDMLGSQRGHAEQWQVCLAHLLRDARYAMECGDTAFSALFHRLLLRAVAIGRRRDTLKDTTLSQYRADLDRRLDRILAGVPLGEPGRKLRKRIAANRAHLFVFVTDRRVPATNNISERHLRPSVIFRKVTNGFRCEWGAETYAAFRSVVSTAKANRASVLDVLRFVLQAPSQNRTANAPG